VHTRIGPQTEDRNAHGQRSDETECRIRKLPKPCGSRPWKQFWRGNRRCATDSGRISVEDSSCPSGHGEGFCAIHDVAVAIRKLQADGTVKKVMVVDTDVHHGNGTAAIFGNDPTFFTISIIGEQLSAHKPPSSIDLNMADRVDDMSIWAR